MNIKELKIVDDKVFKDCKTPADLCTCCFTLMESKQLTFVREKATKSEDFGNRQSPFADLRHFIGRLGNHVQVVKVLVAGARRFPSLVEEYQINVVNGPSSPTLPPPLRNKLTLAGVVKRMTSCDEELTKDLENRLVKLNDALGIEEILREKYGEKNLKPRVHAELILLEYFYRERNRLHFFDNDRYIGASKPACYCCYLYIHEHPGDIAHPPTHQRLYLNWLPPTSTPEVQEPNSETAVHELKMLNSMVKAIRKRTIEQLKTQTGGERRTPHFDSITWESLPNQRSTTGHDEHSPVNVSDIGGMLSIQMDRGSQQTDDSDVKSGPLADARETIDGGLSMLLNKRSASSISQMSRTPVEG